MTRPTRIVTLVKIAQAQAERGTCERLRVGAVIHRDGRILTTGYNGAPAGLPHCEHAWWRVPTQAELVRADKPVQIPLWVQSYVANARQHPSMDVGSGWPQPGTYFYRERGQVIWKGGSDAQVMPPCETAAHAERNAIDWAARHGIRLEGAELVTTDTPCWQCAGSIINAGIISVVAVRPYRDNRGRMMLEDAGVACSMLEDVQ